MTERPDKIVLCHCGCVLKEDGFFPFSGFSVWKCEKGHEVAHPIGGSWPEGITVYVREDAA